MRSIGGLRSLCVELNKYYNTTKDIKQLNLILLLFNDLFSLFLETWGERQLCSSTIYCPKRQYLTPGLSNIVRIIYCNKIQLCFRTIFDLQSRHGTLRARNAITAFVLVAAYTATSRQMRKKSSQLSCFGEPVYPNGGAKRRMHICKPSSMSQNFRNEIMSIITRYLHLRSHRTCSLNRIHVLLVPHEERHPSRPTNVSSKKMNDLLQYFCYIICQAHNQLQPRS